MFKSTKDAFRVATKKLNALDYEVGTKVSDYRPKETGNGFARTMRMVPIIGTDGIVLVITEKVAGMPASYQILVVNGAKAIDMKLHAMTQPSDESYHELLN